MRKRSVQSRDKILDDLARVAGGTVSILSGLGRQVQGDMKARAEDLADKLDLVPRDDFDRVEALLAQSIKKQAELEARITRLEGGKSVKKTTAKRKAKKT